MSGSVEVGKFQRFSESHIFTARRLAVNAKSLETVVCRP
jgi:hypothetical protein